MSTKFQLSKNSGQISLVGAIVVVTISLFFAIIIYFLMIKTGNTFDHQVDERIKHNTEEVKKNAMMTVALEDRMQHAAVEEREEWRDLYENRSVYKVVSYYFSTPDGEKIWINSEGIGKSVVEEDLEKYFENKLAPLGSLRQRAFYLRITGEKSSTIEAADPKDYQPQGDHHRSSFPITLNNGGEATLDLWTRSSTGVSSNQ